MPKTLVNKRRPIVVIVSPLAIYLQIKWVNKLFNLNRSEKFITMKAAQFT